MAKPVRLGTHRGRLLARARGHLIPRPPHQACGVRRRLGLRRPVCAHHLVL